MTFRESEIELVSMAQGHLDIEWSRIFMGELGDQRIILNDRVIEYCKSYYKNKGCKHLSFDLNGLNGAIKIDLSSNVPKKYHGLFDIITNAGTTEHITDGQEKVFENIHNMVKVGGLIVHSIPAQGCWAGHCPHRYSKNFIEKISNDNGYKIILNEYRLRRKKDYLITGILEKTRDEFIVGDWIKEIDRSVNYKINTDNYK